MICRENTLNFFITCWLGILTLSTGEMKFVNAGHCYPVHIHEKEISFLKTKPNFVLGGMDETVYKEHSVTLAKGDSLLVYTDGVSEANNEKGELFGDDRLLQAARLCEAEAPEAACKTILEQVEAFVGDAPQFDDITMLSFLYNGKVNG